MWPNFHSKLRILKDFFPPQLCNIMRKQKWNTALGQSSHKICFCNESTPVLLQIWANGSWTEEKLYQIVAAKWTLNLFWVILANRGYWFCPSLKVFKCVVMLLANMMPLLAWFHCSTGDHKGTFDRGRAFSVASGARTKLAVTTKPKWVHLTRGGCKSQRVLPDSCRAIRKWSV